MKTTLDLPDDLLRNTKIHAAQHNRKLKDVVADALRAALAAPVDAPSARLEPAPATGSTPSRASRQGASGSRPLNDRGNGDHALASAAQRRRRFDALLAQIDLVADRQDATNPLAWDELGLPR